MHRIDHSTNNASLPAPDAAGTPGYFKKGDPGLGIPATVVTQDWGNAVQEELAYVILQAGLVLSKTDNTQLRQAIQNMIQSANSAVIITGATFEASVANGEAVRWDSTNSRFDEAIADGTANNQAAGIADVTNSKVYCYGETPALFAGLTPGARYYLSAATAGAITVTPPTDQVLMGVAKSATAMFVDIDPNTNVQTPTGSLTMYAGAAAPSGWLICDGAAINRTTYAALFAVVGTAFGVGDGSTTFNLPNFKGRSPVGVGQGNTAEGGGLGTNRALAAAGGAETHTLTTPEIPAHTHSETQYQTNTTGGANLWLAQTGAGTGVTGSAGGDGAHNNMSPFLAVNFIIKT